MLWRTIDTLTQMSGWVNNSGILRGYETCGHAGDAGAVSLSFVLIAINAAAQVVAGPDDRCNDKLTITVTVSDSSGVMIPNAFVLFRADLAGTFQPKPVLVELQTNPEGRATAF